MNEYRRKIEKMLADLEKLPISEEIRKKEAASRELQRQICDGERPGLPDGLDPFGRNWWWLKVPQWSHLQ